MHSARKDELDTNNPFLAVSEALKKVIALIKDFYKKDLDISDDLIRQMIGNTFEYKKPEDVIKYFIQQLAVNLGKSSYPDLGLHCRIIALFISRVSDVTLRKETLDLLLKSSERLKAADRLEQACMASALGRFPELPEKQRKMLVAEACKSIQPSCPVRERQMACRVLESVASSQCDMSTTSECVSTLFKYVDDDSQEICDLSRGALINVMFSSSHLYTNQILAGLIHTQLSMLVEKIAVKPLTQEDEAALLGFGEIRQQDASPVAYVDRAKQFALFKDLLKQADFIQNYLEDCFNLEAKIPVAVIMKMAEFAFGKNPNTIVDFFLDRLTANDGYTINLEGKIDMIAFEIVNLFADQVTSPEVKKKATDKLKTLCQQESDIGNNHVLLARFGNELTEDEIKQLLAKANSWINGTNISSTAHYQISAAHILGALGSVVRRDKYKNISAKVRHQCVEALVRQIKMEAGDRDEYVASVICFELIEIMRHTNKLGMATIMTQCLAHTLTELERNTSNINPESKLKPIKWRETLFGIKQPEGEKRDDELDYTACNVM